MKIAVMGAGAVGCYFGGMLARAGNEVVLIGRPAHVDAIQRDGGLLLETVQGSWRVALQASTEAAAVRGARLVLFCVKSGDTEAAGAQIASHLKVPETGVGGPGIEVWSLQNGVDNAPRLAQVLQREVRPAVVYVAAGMAGPGHVKHHGRGELVLEAFPGIGDFQSGFAAAGLAIQTSDNVAGALWSKLVMNCCYNAISAITQLPYGRFAQGWGVPQVMRDVMDECLAVARALDVVVPGDVWESVERIARTMPGQLSSTAQDLARGHPSEIDYLNGYVVRNGERLGVPAPVNRVLHALVRLIEDAPE